MSSWWDRTRRYLGFATAGDDAPATAPPERVTCAECGVELDARVLERHEDWHRGRTA